VRSDRNTKAEPGLSSVVIGSTKLFHRKVVVAAAINPKLNCIARSSSIYAGAHAQMCGGRISRTAVRGLQSKGQSSNRSAFNPLRPIY
jgi:hypothetical protein